MLKMEIILEFIRYCFVGGTAFVIDTSIFYILTEKIKLVYFVSAAISFTVGIVINYILSKKWVFKVGKQTDIMDFIKFVIIGLIGLGITEILLWIGIDLLNQIAIIVKIVAAGIVLMWNYIARKIFVFGKLVINKNV